jgi:hypothetical protein
MMSRCCATDEVLGPLNLGVCHVPLLNGFLKLILKTF